MNLFSTQTHTHTLVYWRKVNELISKNEIKGGIKRPALEPSAIAGKKKELVHVVQNES